MFEAITHHLARLVNDRECSAEIEGDRQELEQRIEKLEARLTEAEDWIKNVEERVDQPDWRQRR